MESRRLNNRIIYLDLLRILATFAVVVVHVDGNIIDSTNIMSTNYAIICTYSFLAHFCCPIFVMLSGVIFLNPNKNISFKDMYFKYIFRISRAFVFWSPLYAFYTSFTYTKEINTVFIKTFIINFLNGHYHMWFLWMLIGLYIITPILRVITKTGGRSTLKYFIILFLIFGISIPFLLNDLKISPLQNFQSLVNDIDVTFVVGWVGYYIIGYYIFTYDVSKRIELISYALGVIAIIISLIFFHSGFSAEYNILTYFSPNVTAMCLAIFILFCKKISKIHFSNKIENIIFSISSCSFGIYLIHDFVNILLFKVLLNINSYNTLFIIPLSVFVFTVSFFIIYFMRKIPWLKIFM